MKTSLQVKADTYPPGFEMGWDAFKDGVKPIDNPHFAIETEGDLFNAWSDGWHSAKDASLPVKDRLLTFLRKPRGGKTAWWTRNDLIGITATWGADRNR